MNRGRIAIAITRPASPDPQQPDPQQPDPQQPHPHQIVSITRSASPDCHNQLVLAIGNWKKL